MNPVRLGYVIWRPADLASRTVGVTQQLVDAWVLPSYTQDTRVADGSIDLAIRWVRAEDLPAYGLEAQLPGADRLYAVVPGDGHLARARPGRSGASRRRSGGRPLAGSQQRQPAGQAVAGERLVQRAGAFGDVRAAFGVQGDDGAGT